LFQLVIGICPVFRTDELMNHIRGVMIIMLASIGSNQRL